LLVVSIFLLATDSRVVVNLFVVVVRRVQINAAADGVERTARHCGVLKLHMDREICVR
jgi:hypothetical protein